MTILATDTCARSNQTGFGTASDGQVWSMAGASVTTSISSSEALFNQSTGFAYALLGTKTTSNINMLVRIEQDTTTIGIGPFFRYIDPNNTYFTAFFIGQLQVYKVVAGSLTRLAAVNLSNYSAGAYWWCRTIMSGTEIQSRAWADGSSEPGTWMIDITDSQFAGPGQFGMSVNGGGNPARFDHLTITDNLADVITVNASLMMRSGSAVLYVRA